MPRKLTSEEIEAQKDFMYERTVKLIARKDIDSITLDDILDEVQMAKGSFYKYYPSKEIFLYEVIKKNEPQFIHLKWVSEPDKGIYNAMNKGLRMASGEYIQILNSADCLAEPYVTERMLLALENAGNPSIFYGNMVKCFPDGRRVTDKCFAGQKIRHRPVSDCKRKYPDYRGRSYSSYYCRRK